MAIALSDELQELESLGTNRALTALCGSSMSFGELPAKHRASGYALEALEGRFGCQMNCRNTNIGLGSKMDSGKSSNLTNRFRQLYRSLHQAALLDTKNGHLKR